MVTDSLNINLANHFLNASYSVLEMVLEETPTRSDAFVERCTSTCEQVNVVIGVTGEVEGYVIFGISLTTANKIASKMYGRQQKMFDKMARSAIAELANMICGNALLEVSEAGFECDITPPTILRGQKIEITTPSIPAILIPIQLAEGRITLSVALQGRTL